MPTLKIVAAPNYTIHSEVRQLCSANMHAFTADFTALHCFPKQVEGRSFAYHNNDLSFYHRSAVYREMGFTESYGPSEMGLSGEPSSPFGAAADHAVAAFIARKAEREPGFHYWMTIDMHSPYDSNIRSLPHASPLENYWKLRRGTMAALKLLVGRLPQYEVVVIGDHAPKFFGSDDHQFLPGQVPVLHLTPCIEGEHAALKSRH